MPKGTVKEVISAPSDEVFDLIHNYERRLEWDTLLQKAYLEPEFTVANLGAISVCQGRQILGGFALRTQYISFQRGKIAAIKMLNQPPFFDTFAASIAHRELSNNQSEVIYTFNFTAQPRCLRFILHPIMVKIFAWETGKRLQALKHFFEKS